MKNTLSPASPTDREERERQFADAFAVLDWMRRKVADKNREFRECYDETVAEHGEEGISDEARELRAECDEIAARYDGASGEPAKAAVRGPVRRKTV